ncbi:MAG: hypothetical protein ACKORI_06910, partial [Verrucomicrobiota bacterium]
PGRPARTRGGFSLVLSLTVMAMLVLTVVTIAAFISIEARLMVDAYHEFSHPAEMLASIRKALRPKGRIYLLEFRAEDPEVPIRALHKMSVAQARKEFEACGFKFIESRPGLPWQHLLVFERP